MNVVVIVELKIVIIVNVKNALMDIIYLMVNVLNVILIAKNVQSQIIIVLLVK